MKCRNIGLAMLLSHMSLVSLLWVTSHAAIAAELEWIGAIDNDVTNGANWSGGVAPGGTDRANFRNGESTNPTPNVGCNNVTWDQLRFNNIGPTTINGTGTITLNNLDSNGNGQAAVYSEGGNVGPSIINPNIVTTGVVQVNGDHDLTFNGTVTAGMIQAFGGTTSIYNGNVTVTDEFIFGNAVAVFNGDYRRNVCDGCGVGMGITNSGSDITFTTFSSNDPNHPNGVDILNLYNGHTIRNGQDNTFNDTKPWSRNGTANIYSLNGFDDSVEFFGTDGGSSMAIQFGAASGANSLVWETPNFMNGGTYPVTQFEIGTDSLELGAGAPELFTDDLLAMITIDGIPYAATDPGNGSPYWNRDINNFAQFFNLPDLTGDYNENGVVDAADYTVWREHLGMNFALPNRGMGISGPVSPADYDAWKAHFGATGGGGASVGVGASVPEPTSLVLLVVGGFVFGTRRLRQGIRPGQIFFVD